VSLSLSHLARPGGKSRYTKRFWLLWDGSCCCCRCAVSVRFAPGFVWKLFAGARSILGLSDARDGDKNDFCLWHEYTMRRWVAQQVGCSLASLHTASACLQLAARSRQPLGLGSQPAVPILVTDRFVHDRRWRPWWSLARQRLSNAAAAAE